ncbi:Bardet-Biedl syndrome 1 protein [Chamberlinius hualienensis]
MKIPKFWEIPLDLNPIYLKKKSSETRGTNVMSENVLIDMPTGVVAFHIDNTEPRVAAVGVACGSNIYIYKNLKPYFKFTLPSLDINPSEKDVWEQAKEDKLDVVTLREILEGIRNEIGETNLTPRSQRFLLLDPEEMVPFANLHKSQPLKKQTVITCFGTLKKSMYDEDAISCLVLGTESQHVHILDPQAFTILASATIPSVPVFFTTMGLFDVEYRITVACRDGCIYTLKRGSKQAHLCMKLSHQMVTLSTIGKYIIVGCINKTLQCFNSKGKQMWCHHTSGNILTTQVVELNHLSISLLAVAVEGDGVHFYSDKYLVGRVAEEETITAITFGRFGREDNSLALVTRDGGLMIKILKRTARFEVQDTTVMRTNQTTSKLGIPKRTKLFVDQTMRERENSAAMHRVYQQDLYKLRLHTARCYVEALESNLNLVSVNPADNFRLSARVQGLGPVFCLKVELQNMASSKLSSDLFVTFTWDQTIYSVENSCIMVPPLVPGIQYTFQTMVKCLSEVAISNAIKVWNLFRNNILSVQFDYFESSFMYKTF